MDITILCKDHHLRLTGPRLIILKVLLKSKDHPDAVELHRRVTKIEPGISLATVYRTLKLFEEKGVLEKHSFGDGPARFERADQEHHDHLINVETGDVIEFRSSGIEKLQEKIAREFGFFIVSHRLEIYVRPLKEEIDRHKCSRKV
ncbi:MAG: ferric uptake regulator [Candidatus Tokpelaia sp. JSC085]|nr:MAG: ferric uptake regulator [Candidatus Tokpelaia sp. JSC085]